MGKQSHFPCLTGDLRVTCVFFVNEVEAGVPGGLHGEL